MTERRRAILAEKFADLANYAVAALVFGQAVGQEAFSLRLGVMGMAVWALFMAGTYLLSGEDQ